MSSNSIKQDNIAVIQSFGKKTEKLETWKYWEIVGELIWRGADRFQAEDAAKWCLRAETGEEKTIDPDIQVKIKGKK